VRFSVGTEMPQQSTSLTTF